MKILSITTATNHLSVALNDDDQVISEKNEQDQRNHSEHLDPMIQDILTENRLSLQDIDRFAVAIGPGSYTGLRIGITTVKMFASILEKEVVGISTLKSLAKGIDQKDSLIIAMLDARNDNYFAGGYFGQALANVIPDGHYHIDQLLEKIKKFSQENNIDQVVFVGSGIDKHDELVQKLGLNYTYGSESQNELRAGLIGKLAVNEEAIDPDKLLPRYLRRTQAEVDWHKRTGKPFAPDSDYVEEV